jgi:hypothetical protein
VLSKLEYLAVCRSFQLLTLHARGDAAKALEILLLLLPRSRWSACSSGRRRCSAGTNA